MSAREAIPEDERLLHAYHDGELGWLARWHFERRLAHSPGLRRELEALDTLGDLARRADAAGPAPDLWADIAGRLPALDAEREAASARGPDWSFAAPLLQPLAATAAVAALVVAVAVGLRTGETGGARPASVVRWMDAGPHNVLVLEDESRDATIIWVLDADPQVSQGARRDMA